MNLFLLKETYILTYTISMLIYHGMFEVLKTVFIPFRKILRELLDDHTSPSIRKLHNENGEIS